MAQDEADKQRVKDAIAKFEKKSEPKIEIAKRKNGAPEKEFETEALRWLRTNGFHVSIVESKATYNPKAGRYISQSVKQGFVDVVGNHNTGIAVYIELKAPGRRSTLRMNQREFLLEKIESGCFGACVDNIEILQNQWEKFKKFRTANQIGLSKDFLRAALPTERVVRDVEALFPED